MNCENKIDVDEPAYLCLEYVSTANETLVFTKGSSEAFNPNMELVIASQERNGFKIDTLTVGNGIVINGNDVTVTIDTLKYEKYNIVYGIFDIINAGYRDVIMKIVIIRNY